MTSLIESLASLSKVKLPGPQLTSLVEVLWKVRILYLLKSLKLLQYTLTVSLGTPK